MSVSAGGEEEVKRTVPLADLTEVDRALVAGPEALKSTVGRFRPADLGRDLSRRSLDEGRLILLASDDRQASSMLRAAHPGVASQLLANCDPAHSAKILGSMPIDHQVAILGEKEAGARKAIEAAMPAPDRELIERLLTLPAGSIGRLASPRVWRAERTASVGDALADLKKNAARIEVAVNLYVVDAGVLVGVMALREVIGLDPATPLDSVMVKNPISVPETGHIETAADIIKTHDFLSLPVVDPKGRLVGAVRVDDLLDAALERVGKGMLSQGAVTAAAAQVPYFQVSLKDVVRGRLTWLVLLFVAETLTGTVLRHFEEELAKVVALSFFIPLLIGTGGNAGSQTVSTVIRAMALGEVRTSDAGRILAKEALAGVILGILLGLVAFVRAQMWGVSPDLAFCVAITILVVCTWANTVGALVPIAAEKCGVDPTVVSGPLITTLVDASGLFIYFSVAHLTLAQLRGG